MSATPRRPEEIRASIEANRRELGVSLERLQEEWKKTTDWRAHLRRNQQPVLIGAAAAGFVLGGGLGGIVGLFRK